MSGLTHNRIADAPDDNGKEASSGLVASPPPQRLFEDVLDALGAGFVRWQRLVFVLISAADVFGAWAVLLPVFTAATPAWWCTQYVNKSSGQILNVSSAERNSTVSSCTADDGGLACVTYEFDGEFTSIVNEWQLVCGRAYIPGLVTSIQMGGVILGAFVFGQLSDSVGRKPAYYAAHGLLCVGGLAAAFANSWQLYAAFRAVVGAGFGGTMVVNSVFTVELVGRRWRTLCGTIGFWGVGGMTLALLAFLVRAWRHMSMAVALIGLAYFITWPFVPESARWLVQHGRFTAAAAVLSRIAADTPGAVAPTAGSLEAVRHGEQQEETRERRFTYLDLMRRAVYRRRLVVLLAVWAVVFVIYYELSFNLSNFSGNRYLNQFLAGLFDMGGMLAVIIFNNTLGRRFTLTLFLGITCLSNLAMLITSLTGNQGSVILGFALVGKAAAVAGTYVAAIFTAELFPTDIRNIAMGAGSVTARIATVIAPQVVFLGTYYSIAPFIFCLVISALVTPLCFLLPETNGKPLLDSY